jgi:hypothetical protein
MSALRTRRSSSRPGEGPRLYDAMIGLESPEHVIWTALGGTRPLKLCSTHTADGMLALAAILDTAVDSLPAERMVPWLMEC